MVKIYVQLQVRELFELTDFSLNKYRRLRFKKNVVHDRLSIIANYQLD